MPQPAHNGGFMKRLEANNAAASAHLWSMEHSALKRLFSSTVAASGYVRSLGTAPVQPAAPAEAPAPYVVDGDAAIIAIVGPITKYPNELDAICGWCFTLEIQAAIGKVLDDSTVAKIILFVHSPGGMAAGTPDLADFIAQAKSRKPIIAYVSDLCRQRGVLDRIAMLLDRGQSLGVRRLDRRLQRPGRLEQGRRAIGRADHAGLRWAI